MARNNYDFGFDNKSDCVDTSEVVNLDNDKIQHDVSSTHTYERKRLEENLSLLQEVEELDGKVSQRLIGSSQRTKLYEKAVEAEKLQVEKLEKVLEKCEDLYRNIISNANNSKESFSNLTVTISQEARTQLKKDIQEDYSNERKIDMEERMKFKREFVADLKRELRGEPQEIIRSVRKSYEGLFWKTLVIAVACVLITLGALAKNFDGADRWLAILGMLLLMANLIIWAWKYSKLFGKE